MSGPVLLLLLTNEPPATTPAPVITSRGVGPFAFPAVAYEDDQTRGALGATLPAVTAALAGTHTPVAFGTLAGVLPRITAALAGAQTDAPTGTIGATLPSVTAALSGIHTAPTTGTIEGTLPAVTAALTGASTAGAIEATLPAVTAALAGVHVISGVDGLLTATLPAVTAALTGVTIGGTIAATLPAVTSALTGSVAVTGTLAGTLGAVTARIEGSGGVGQDVAFPEKVYRRKKREAERKAAEKAALNKRIRQALGLEPPDPEPELEPIPEGPAGPFFVAPDLASLPLRAELAQLQGQFDEASAARLKTYNEEAFKVLLAADDGTPGLGIDPAILEDAMARMRANGQSVTAFAQEVQALAGQAEEANGQTQQLLEQFAAMQQQTAQALQQIAEMQQQNQAQMAQALSMLAENQTQLTAAVKAPRKKKMNVLRGPDQRVTGAEVIEEGE